MCCLLTTLQNLSLFWKQLSLKLNPMHLWIWVNGTVNSYIFSLSSHSGWEGAAEGRALGYVCHQNDDLPIQRYRSIQSELSRRRPKVILETQATPITVYKNILMEDLQPRCMFLLPSTAESQWNQNHLQAHCYVRRYRWVSKL